MPYMFQWAGSSGVYPWVYASIVCLFVKLNSFLVNGCCLLSCKDCIVSHIGICEERGQEPQCPTCSQGPLKVGWFETPPLQISWLRCRAAISSKSYEKRRIPTPFRTLKLRNQDWHSEEMTFSLRRSLTPWSEVFVRISIPSLHCVTYRKIFQANFAIKIHASGQ